MRSFVLQTSDSDIQNGEVLGRLGFAANEADTGDARAISAVVFAMAEAPFTSTSNPTSIVFATAFDGDATNKLKITSAGNFLPVASGLYNLGSSSLSFKDVYADRVIESGKPVVITDTNIAAGSDIVKNIVSLTNAEYNATTPDNDTAYIITDISPGTGGGVNHTAGSGLFLDSSNEFHANVSGIQSVASNSTTSTASRTYAIQIDPNDQLVVNVPWVDTDTDTDTTYIDGTGLSLVGTTFHANVDVAVQTVSHNSVTSTASRTYVVQVDENDDLVVNVPWVDTDTDTDTNDHLDDVVWDDTTGDLTFSFTGPNSLSDIVENLDGRYHHTITNPVSGVGSANYVARWLDTSTLGTGILYDNGSNLGIGTSSPLFKLDVNGDFSADEINVNDEFTFPTVDGSNGQTLVTDGAGTVSWSTASTTDNFVSSASFNTGDGILSLGRTGGLADVTVDLDGRYQQTLTNPVTGTGSTNYVARWSSSNILTTGVLYDDGTDVGISNTSPDCRLTLGANITGVSNDGISVNMEGVNKPSFTTRRSTSNPVFSILPYTSQIYLSAGVYYNGAGWVHSSNDVHNCIFTLDPGNGVLWYAGNNGSSISNVASAELLWDTAGNWKSCVKSDDPACHNYMLGSLSVGDNHSVQSSKLHLKQDETYSTASSTTSTFTQYIDTDIESTENLTNYTIGIDIDARKNVSNTKTDAGYIMAGDFNGALDGASTGTLEGSYGIRTFAGIRDAGTVNNAYGVYSRVLNLGTGTINNGFGVYINNVNATNGYGVYQTGPDDSNYFAGSVGIGLSNPSYKLDISGSIRSNLASNNKCIFRTTNIVAKIQPYDADSTTYIGNESNHDLVFRTSNIDRLSIEAAGNVGIGTINPTEKLEVNGNIKADSFNAGGTSSQFLKADGSVDSNTYLVTETDPVFGAHTVSNIANGTGFLKNNGTGTWSYDNSTYLTSVTFSDIAAAAIVTEAEGISSNDNDTTIPTSAAVKDYVDNNGGGGSSNLIRGSFAVTTSTSVFTVSGGYNTGSLDVYQNGVKLFKGSSYDFTETGGGTTFTLANAATNGDLIEYVALNASTSATGNTSLGSVSVTTNQTVFNTSDTFTSSNLAVFLNGVKLVDGTDYNVTSSSQFTLTSTAVSGDVVEYIAYGATVASSNLAKTGDTMTGNLTVNADLIVTGYKETHTDNGNTGTAQTIDISDSTLQTYTLTGNCTFTMPTADAGRSFTMFLKTGAGSFVVTFTNVKFPQNSAPTITTDASRMDIITFYSDGTNWYGSIQQEYHV